MAMQVRDPTTGVQGPAPTWWSKLVAALGDPDVQNAFQYNVGTLGAGLSPQGSIGQIAGALAAQNAQSKSYAKGQNALIEALRGMQNAAANPDLPHISGKTTGDKTTYTIDLSPDKASGQRPAVAADFYKILGSPAPGASSAPAIPQSSVQVQDLPPPPVPNAGAGGTASNAAFDSRNPYYRPPPIPNEESPPYTQGSLMDALRTGGYNGPFVPSLPTGSAALAGLTPEHLAEMSRGGLGYATLWGALARTGAEEESRRYGYDVELAKKVMEERGALIPPERKVWDSLSPAQQARWGDYGEYVRYTKSPTAVQEFMQATEDPRFAQYLDEKGLTGIVQQYKDAVRFGLYPKNKSIVEWAQETRGPDQADGIARALTIFATEMAMKQGQTIATTDYWAKAIANLSAGGGYADPASPTDRKRIEDETLRLLQKAYPGANIQKGFAPDANGRMIEGFFDMNKKTGNVLQIIGVK